MPKRKVRIRIEQVSAEGLTGWVVSEDSDTFENDVAETKAEAQDMAEDWAKDLYQDGYAVEIEGKPYIPYHPSADRLADKVWDILDEAGATEWYFYPGYSGRGMFGTESAIAFKTGVAPDSKTGKKLEKLGFRVDSLGRGYIYYWGSDEVTKR